MMTLAPRLLLQIARCRIHPSCRVARNRSAFADAEARGERLHQLCNIARADRQTMVGV